MLQSSRYKIRRSWVMVFFVPLKKASTRTRTKKIKRRKGSFFWIGLLVLAIWIGLLVHQWFEGELAVVSLAKEQYPRVVMQEGEDSSAEILWVKKRPSTWVTYSEVSPIAVHAIVISEDWAFFQHKGYDPQQISEALKLDWEKKKFVRGASTITQQVTKNLFLNQDKTLWRKAKELLLAIELEKTVSKRKILELYLNIAEWGPGVFGIGPASYYYFGHAPASLGAREAAFLAMLLPSPRRYSQSFRDRKLTPYAESTIRSILEKLRVTSHLTQEEYDVEVAKTLEFR